MFGMVRMTDELISKQFPGGSIVKKFVDSDIQAAIDSLTKTIEPGHGRAWLKIDKNGVDIVGVEKINEHWSVVGAVGKDFGKKLNFEIDGVLSW